MSVSDEDVARVQNYCSIDDYRAREALLASNQDVEKSVYWLIDNGWLLASMMNPRTATDDMFESVIRYHRLMECRLDVHQGRGNGKTAEQLLEEKDALQASRLREFRLQKHLNDPIPSAGFLARQGLLTQERSKAIRANPLKIKISPLPTLTRNLGEWAGKGTVEAFAGMQARLGGYNAVSSRKPSTGTFSLIIPRLDEDDQNPRPPAPEQVAAYRFLREHQDAFAGELLRQLLAYYLKLKALWLENEPGLDLPHIETMSQMKQNIGVGTLHMYAIAKEGLAYFGLELGCTWDEEHGAGVVVHGNRIIEVGPADTSFTGLQLATADGGTELS